MANNISREIKAKTDAQLRLLEQENKTIIKQTPTGEVYPVTPAEYQQSMAAGKNITITTSGNIKTINAVMNLMAGSNITISEPDAEGQVTITGTIKGKEIDIGSFTGKDGYILTYDETADKFILAEITIDPVVVEKTIAFYIHGDLEIETNAMKIIAMDDMEIKEIKIELSNAPVSQALIIDINKNGSTLYTTQANRPTIPIASTTNTVSLPDVVTINAGDRITLDIDQNGGGSLAISIKCEVI